MKKSTAWVLALISGVAIGAVIGFAAYWFRGADPAEWPIGLVFGLATGLPVIAFVQAALDKRGSQPEHGEETIEFSWMQRAQSDALLDILVLTGVTTAVCSIADVEIPGMDLVLGFLLVDVFVRYALIRRREA